MTKILLVEDDKSLREIYGVRLLAEGYDIVSAGDGEEALAMAIKERPDLIVSDVMMPKISGFDMLDILRSTTETRNIKVIMMTALSSEDQRARGEQLGADRYLVKSQVGIEDVVNTVHDVLEDRDTMPAPAAPQAAPLNQAGEPGFASAGSPADSGTLQALENELRASPEAAPAFAAADLAPAPTTPNGIITPTSPASDPIPTPAPAPAPQPFQPTPESALPRPTAPFSSPRPNNLGERVIHPLEDAQPTASVNVSQQIAQELSAPVEEPVSFIEEPAPFAPTQPIDEPEPFAPSQFKEPVEEVPSELPPQPTQYDQPIEEPAQESTETPAADYQEPAPVVDESADLAANIEQGRTPAPFSHDYHAPIVNESVRPSAPGLGNVDTQPADSYEETPLPNQG